MSRLLPFFASALVATWLATPAPAQEPPPPPIGPPEGGRFGPGPDGPMGQGGRGMGPMAPERELVARFDEDRDGKLNLAERQKARELLALERKNRPARGGMPGGPGRRGPGGREREPAKPGPKMSPADVPSYPDASLYEPGVLRTLFLEFESPDWEDELADFYRTDVEVPATLVVDGKTYPGVGVHFRGASSYFSVGKGYKRSLNVSLDFTDGKQRLDGYKTLNLLNSNGDPSFLSTILYSAIANRHIVAPKANLVRVVINGECWGVYVNTQQFDQKLVTDGFETAGDQQGRGARWKVKGSPGGDAGLFYVGDRVEDYKRRYEIKSKDKPEDWQALIDLCRILTQTPLEELEAALRPVLDLEGALWFLALDNVLINSDGYWIRASDYCIYRDPAGVFHLVPHDMNESFRPAMGPGMRGPRGPGMGQPPEGMRPPGGERAQPGPGRAPAFDLDPLVGLDEARKPLRSRLLAVPSLRARYLEMVRSLAEKSLDWQWLGPIVESYRELASKAIEADTRKLSPHDAFLRTTSSEAAPDAAAPGDRRPAMGLRAFAEGRRTYLLQHAEVKALAGKSKKGV